jgi:hypothetical protein
LQNESFASKISHYGRADCIFLAPKALVDVAHAVCLAATWMSHDFCPELSYRAVHLHALLMLASVSSLPLA